MKNLFKNKAIIGLFILMLGFTYVKSTPINNLEETNTNKEEIVYKNN